MNSTVILPQSSAEIFLTDGGLETTLVFLEGFELPCFAAFDLLKTEEGYSALKNYYRRYLNIAKKYRTGFILESPTWRSNPDWIEKVGYPAEDISAINEKAVLLMEELRLEFAEEIENIIISGCIGPRGDGYKPEFMMTAEAAEEYHAQQIGIFSKTPVDMVTAITMNYAEEAIGICNAAAQFNLPAVISFTVETDGKLITGMSLKEAIELVDNQAKVKPLYFMINCAHPTHFSLGLPADQQHWAQRIKGIRANASCKSHAELDESTELDRGNPHTLGSEYKHLKGNFSQLNVFGCCCGTDEEHIFEIANQVRS